MLNTGRERGLTLNKRFACAVTFPGSPGGEWYSAALSLLILYHHSHLQLRPEGFRACLCLQKQFQDGKRVQSRVWWCKDCCENDTGVFISENSRDDTSRRYSNLAKREKRVGAARVRFLLCLFQLCEIWFCGFNISDSLLSHYKHIRKSNSHVHIPLKYKLSFLSWVLVLFYSPYLVIEASDWILQINSLPKNSCNNSILIKVVISWKI